jgi:hypothetical protein
MEDQNYYLEQINAKEHIDLSWVHSRVMSIIAAVVVFIVALVMFNKFFVWPMKSNVLIGLLLMAVLLGLSIYQVFLTAWAQLVGRKLLIQKLLGPEQEIDLSQVEKISSFPMKSTYYTIIKYRDANGLTQRALIHNSRSPLFGYETPAAEILRFAQSIFGLK